MKRRELITMGAFGTLAACSGGSPFGGFTTPTLDSVTPSVSYAEIDQKANGVRNRLFANNPNAQTVANGSVAYLIIPEVTKGGIILGGVYGNGSMFQGNNIVGHYSLAGVSVGLQLGAQSFSYALFFVTPAAYQKFQNSLGLEFGVDAEYALPRGGASFGDGSQTFLQPVYALVFNQAGLMAGASVEGAKFTAF